MVFPGEATLLLEDWLVHVREKLGFINSADLSELHSACQVLRKVPGLRQNSSFQGLTLPIEKKPHEQTSEPCA